MSCSRSHKMIFRRDRGRPLEARLVADQRYDMAGADVIDGFVEARKRADVNHGILDRGILDRGLGAAIILVLFI